jgi:O-acetyl-ADP-ribose deacetylase (regulator of RNase III)
MANRSPGSAGEAWRAAPLDLHAYRARLELDVPFHPPPPAAPAERAARVERLLAHLQQEGLEYPPLPASSEYAVQRRRLRALLTLRQPEPALPAWFHTAMDSILQAEAAERGRLPAASLPRLAQQFPAAAYPAAAHCSLWRGDITTLQADAIVNAANARLLGCFQPFHTCIDNVIHSAAGPRLREDCHAILHLQGRQEGTGWAKATRGYNLPAKYVLHTVGPVVSSGAPSPQQDAELAACYRACLALAARLEGVRSVAFCCISTGVFGFPNRPAARIALQSAAEWLAEHPGALEQVIFNVFTALDDEIYRSLLSS